VIQTADEILVRFSMDPVLMEMVGQYHFKDGEVHPSMAVLASHQQVPGLDHIKGLEIVVARAPDAKPVPIMTVDPDCPPMMKEFRCYLIQYEGTHGNTIVHAADRIMGLCPNASYRHLGSGFSDLAGVEQIQVKLPPYVLLQDLEDSGLYEIWDAGNFMTGENPPMPWKVYDGGQLGG
jgi:hypothetical protein